MKQFFYIILFFLSTINGLGQSIPYGNNPTTGNYFNVGDAKIYYEIYGKGKPIVLLHGGIYGYIDEFGAFIDRFSKQFQVICIATRGHGKSELGKIPCSYAQRAEDAYKVIRHITKDSVMLMGFSDGGYSAFKLAALHPELVSKLLVIGAADFPKEGRAKKYNYNPEDLIKSDSSFFKGRLALMPEPERWRESLTNASKMYNEDYVSTETFSKIQCPVLVLNGDRDENLTLDAIVRCSKAIKDVRVSVIAGCWHVVFFCNFPAVWESIRPFLEFK
jgi:pimeloyl-ACP methyl ester carboxylesterase